MIATLVGKYVIDQEIGKGAFGVVYLGHHQSNEQDQVAIKVLENNGHLEQQLAEPEMLSRLKHPNIVRLREYFVYSNQLIIVLDYISGGDLKSALESGRVFSQDEVHELLRSMASALAFAHERNIVHRDIKMANIMLDDAGGQLRFILTDFGIGRVAEGVQDRPNTGGTYLFMAPEQFRGRPVPQSDLWAVGVVAYYMLSGKMPFHGDSLHELSHSILFSNPNAPSVAAGKQIEAKLDLLVAQLIEKSLNERVSSAKELLRLLGGTSGTLLGTTGSVFHAIVGQKSVSSSVPTGMDSTIKRLRRQRKTALIFALLFGTLIALGSGLLHGIMKTLGIGLFYWSQSRSGPNAFRWWLGSCVVLGITWFSFSVNSQSTIENEKEIKPAIKSDVLFTTAKISRGVFVVLAWVSYPLFALAVASHRRTGRKLGNLSLLIENPISDPLYLDKMKSIVAVRPNDLLFRIKYVETMLSLGHLEDVIIECQLILEIDPYNFSANLLLANALIELGLFEDAATVCREYLEVSGYCFEFQMLLERCKSQGAGQ